jgi:hypothetical protein
LALALYTGILLLVVLEDALDCNHDLLHTEAVVVKVYLEAAGLFADNLGLFDAPCYVVLAASAHIAVAVIRV